MRYICLVLGLLTGASAASAQQAITISRDLADCISDNVDAYLLAGGETIIVIPATCPKPATMEDVMIALAPQNSGAGLPEPKIGAPDAALLLLRSEFQCLARLIAAGELPETEQGYLSFSVDLCDG